MTVLATTLMVIGGAVAVLAGIGILRFSTPYARLHAAGKASPVAFLIAAVGAGIQLGAGGAAALAIAGAAMVLTLPVGVHLLFKAVHRTTDNRHLLVDDLAPAEDEADQDPR
ncbi:cation:proton antiporter [Candidatus Poriferisocius sp.]|uniref:cation:proton antiporter n=1 Tax=Candidatus Poriferisocius sp. TaxID=3101276 RepID=UPI003B599034